MNSEMNCWDRHITLYQLNTRGLMSQAYLSPINVYKNICMQLYWDSITDTTMNHYSCHMVSAKPNTFLQYSSSTNNQKPTHDREQSLSVRQAKIVGSGAHIDASVLDSHSGQDQLWIIHIGKLDTVTPHKR